jgi:hypothetical protein
MGIMAKMLRLEERCVDEFKEKTYERFGSFALPPRAIYLRLGSKIWCSVTYKGILTNKGIYAQGDCSLTG